MSSPSVLWTIRQALAWVIWRSEECAERFGGPGAELRWAAETVYPDAMLAEALPRRDALEALNSALRQGQLTARSGGTPIHQDTWSEIQVGDLLGQPGWLVASHVRQMWPRRGVTQVMANAWLFSEATAGRMPPKQEYRMKAFYEKSGANKRQIEVAYKALPSNFRTPQGRPVIGKEPAQ